MFASFAALPRTPRGPRMSNPTADVSVRIAWGDDADAIAAVQVRAWQVL